MPSRLTITKLEAFLIMDLIFFGATAGAYFYLQNQGLVAVGSKPAKFIVTDLTINPPEAEVFEPVLVTVNVTNIGDEAGNYVANLTINNVVVENQTILVPGRNSTLAEFTVLQETEGTYTVEIGGLSGLITFKFPSPTSSKIGLSKLVVNPYEAWPNEKITATVTATNIGEEPDSLSVRFMVDSSLLERRIIKLAAKETTTVEFTFNETIEGKHTIEVNSLTGTFTIVPTGYHTLQVSRSGGGSKPLTFTLNGIKIETTYIELLPVGEYTIIAPEIVDLGTGVLEFAYWNDGDTSTSKTFTLDKRLILVATYLLISGYASCPSLYVWNGTGYIYVAEVSNSGWLGDIDHINANGQIVFAGGNKWDYIRLGTDLIPRAEGYFDMVLTQQWDELFYFDSAYMMVVDHPADVDVYTTMSTYVNTVFNDQIYTVNPTSLMSPVNATYIWAPVDTNEIGENVLSLISQLDGVFTPGNNGLYSQSWNNISLNQLTIDLGNLSGANQIKLVINGMADWGDPAPYYPWIASFEAAAAQGLLTDNTEMCPAPYMEVKDANGNWIRVPKDKQIPLPSDWIARTFVVDITELFPIGATDYQIRISNFWNITWDYIGIDLSAQEPLAVQKIIPDNATLSQLWETLSKSSGAFTRYGDVAPLMQNADEMYVIGRQGDQILLRFPIASLTAPDAGMEREYFLVTACFYKDEPGAWGFGFEFSVDPLPFQGMSGYPYPDTESYPYDAEHLAYLEEYNTRIVSAP